MKTPDRPSAHDLPPGKLPDWAIKELIKDGTIKINPLPENWEEMVSSVTIDFHLGSPIRFFREDGNDTIDSKYSTREDIENMMILVDLKPGQPIVLEHGKTIIAPMEEELDLPDNILGKMEGKTTLARISVVPFMGADRFDPGWLGHPVAEIGTFLTNKKVILYGGMSICAFSFEKLAWAVENPYRRIGSYSGSSEAMVSNLSRLHR